MSDRETVETLSFDSDSPALRSQILGLSFVQVAVVWIAVAFAFAAAGFFFGRHVDPSSRSLYSATFFLIGPTYFAWVFGAGAYRRYKAAFAKLRTVPGATRMTGRFSSTILEYWTEAGVSVKVPFVLVNSFKPKDDGILVTLSAGLIWVPKSAFKDQGDFQQAVRWVVDAQMDKAAKPSSPLVRQ